jgi:hypothetical protein
MQFSSYAIGLNADSMSVRSEWEFIPPCSEIGEAEYFITTEIIESVDRDIHWELRALSRNR